jgi:DAK2 domain fusion protein YloV
MDETLLNGAPGFESDQADRPAADTSAVIGTATGLLEKYPANRPITALDGADLSQLFRAAYAWLERHHEEVNRLNVFPVPDGDTGTNMLLTVQSAWAAMAGRREQSVAGVMEALARGAHEGSRGNSGVILGRILYGLNQKLATKSHVTAPDWAEALRHAAEVAYAGVPKPVEGTILTVAREMGQAAARAADRSQDLRYVMEQAVQSAEETVRRTPDLLPVLAEAGVVDAGGKGLQLFFEGMHRALNGLTHLPANTGQVIDEFASSSVPAKGERALPPVRWGFDVQYLVEGAAKPVDQVRSEIEPLGDCVLVEGDGGLIKVHIHVFDPGPVLSYGARLGFMTDVVVENMDDMVAENMTDVAAGAEPGLAADAGDDTTRTTVSLVPHSLTPDGIGLVAVAPGPGFVEIFHDLGVHAVVPGGQTMNPSVGELAAAVRMLPSRRVVILPNNPNVQLAAEQAAAEVASEDPAWRILVVPSATLPQGIAALMGFNPAVSDDADLVADMIEQMALVQTGEVTQAVRAARIGELQIVAGDMIGLQDGELVSCGPLVDPVVHDLLARMDAGSADLITLYAGDFVAEEAVEALAATIKATYPEADLLIAPGGQPHYFYIISVE